uniref:Uncharacterized protein n=1 Tax=Oryza punctata TaxID=4537 RepID=A0A0E0M0E2_ORYPU
MSSRCSISRESQHFHPLPFQFNHIEIVPEASTSPENKGAVYYTHVAATVYDDFPRIVACTVRRTRKCKYFWQHTVRRDASCAIRCALKCEGQEITW